jgi:large subunit ribosomal protein L21
VYAIVQCGGHQVKMIPGATLVVDKVDGEKGAEVSFDRVLMVEKDGGELMAGAPFLAGARVVAVVDGVARGPKIRVFKKKRRKGMRRTKGHRSTYTRVTVKDIVL